MIKPTYIVCAADIGNSRAKVMINGVCRAVEYFPGWAAELAGFLSARSGAPLRLAYGSVNQTALDELKNELHAIENIEIIGAAALLKKQNYVKYDRIEGAGDDRILGLIGAAAYVRPPLITIDCGTATTVNAIDAKGNCRGGAIFAGAPTQMKALERYAEKLPFAGVKYEERAAGINTVQAIRSGVFRSVVGGIKELVKTIYIQEFNAKKVPVIITGGLAEMIIPALTSAKFELHHRPSLILEGIMKLMETYEL